MNERKWQKIIRIARGYYFKGNKHRMKIAELAIEACMIQHGGDRNRLFTVARFAKDIGMHQKTLHHWISIKRNIIDKVPKSLVRGISYEDLRTVILKVNPNSTKKEVISAVEEVRAISPLYKRFNKYIKVLKTIMHNAVNPVKLMELPDHYIEEIIKISTTIINLLTKEMELRKRGSGMAKELALKQVGKYKKNVEALNENT